MMKDVQVSAVILDSVHVYFEVDPLNVWKGLEEINATSAELPRSTIRTAETLPVAKRHVSEMFEHVFLES